MSFFSRTIVPLELRRQWTFWPNYTDVNPASSAVCVDGEIGTVLKTYREVNTSIVLMIIKGSFKFLFGPVRSVFCESLGEHNFLCVP